MLYRIALRILSALDSRIVIVSILGLIILGFYFYITSNNSPPRFSDIQPPSSSPCALDFISQVNCLSNHTLGQEKSSIGEETKQAQQQEQVNDAARNATALEQSGNIKEAIKYYDKALAIQPNNTDFLVAKGDALSKLRNYTEAIKYYSKVLAAYPNSRGSTGLIEGIGNDLYDLGKYKEAIRSYDIALARQPNNPDLLINKGNALFHIENYSGAIKYYDKVLTMAPASVQIKQLKKLAIIALQKSGSSSTK
jgi:tetratricopeptide (TPR) repeat protein